MGLPMGHYISHYVMHSILWLDQLIALNIQKNFVFDSNLHSEGIHTCTYHDVVPKLEIWSVICTLTSKNDWRCEEICQESDY